MEYEPVIGLEVHLHLKTKSKAFCSCPIEFGNEPNSQVCPVCLGFPGSLPVLNKTALEYSIKVGLALNCIIQEYTKFDRKHYYYPDLPKNYQISQYDLPISKDGFLDIIVDGKIKRVNIRRAHLEEDAGKLIHKDDVTLVDYNRAGIPLLEIVSEPDMNSPQEAYEYLNKLKSIIEYLDVSDCDMEKGSLRCDANISLREKGSNGLGIKTELKNMNSFKAVKDALSFEIKRQADLLDDGEKIIQDTRLWNTLVLKTLPMRVKEEAKDYRYFPEPDLPLFIINQDKIAEIKKEIPELPEEKALRFQKEYNILEYDSRILVISKKGALYAEECLKAYPGKDKKPVVNWLIGPLLSEANSRNCNISELKISAKDLIELIGFVERQEISNLSAKSVLTEIISAQKSAAAVIAEKNLLQVSDVSGLENYIIEVIKENSRTVNDYKNGKENSLMFLVGQVMKKSQGKANPKVAHDMLKRRLV
ncbi:MAG: Asp-tRNA(Asn)/Glu-tRNA(Gln) amidotransferase subunit GatB [Candidatus Omnitrophota bacterium]